MSYNILSKNVQFQGATQGTIEDMVDDHSNQTIDGQKTFSNLSASSDVSVVGNISASLNISASNFYANGVLVDPSGGAVSAVSGGADNRIATFSSADALNGEASLTFDGSTKTLEIATSGDPTGIVNLYGTLSGSGNISGSAFYGDGANLDNVNAATATLAAGSGLQNSSGLLVDPSQSTAIAGSINDSDNVTVYSTADSAPRKVTVADIAGRATVPISTYTNTGGNANRVVVSIDGSGVVARTNLTFDDSDLLLTGNMSGSGNLQIGGTVRLDGISTESPNFSQDHIMFVDATDSLVTKTTFSNFCASIAGDGLVNSSGRLAVQVTGAAIVVSDKVGISGSIAGTGLGFTGAANSVSAINLDLTDVGFGGGANRLITDDGDGTVTTEANLTFDGSLLTIAGTGSLDRVVIGGTDPAESRLLISGSNDELLFQVKQQGNGYPTMFLGGENHATYPELLYNRGQFLNLGAISQGNLAGNNGSNTKLTIRKTGVLDNTATSIVAFTIPNANHAAGFKVFGFVTTDSGSRVGTFEQQIAISRVSGSIAAFAGSTRVESSRANSGGSGADFTISTDLTQSGSASASNTLDYELTIDTTDGSSTNAVISVELLNFNDSGITMAAS